MNTEIAEKVPQLRKEVYDRLEPEAREYIDKLYQLVVGLFHRVEELEARLAKNSSNSSKPPSSDGLKKPPRTQSSREKSGKEPGGQPGHGGSTLVQIDNPDTVVRHKVNSCEHCRRSLDEVAVKSVERRQVFEIPVLSAVVTEHQAEIKDCPGCGYENRAQFPATVKAPVVYGANAQALAVYLMNQQLLPYERTADIFADIFSLPLSQGTLFEINRKCSVAIELVDSIIKQEIGKSGVVHFDESGLNCNGKLNWLHVASTEAMTNYGVHSKRGKVAMDEIGILPVFRGVAVHDHWQSYFDYEDCQHALCGAHHLRELMFIHEVEKEPWAGQMKKCLLDILDVVRETKDVGGQSLTAKQIHSYESRYRQILQDGFTYHRRLPPLVSSGEQKRKRGRRKQRTGKNLLDRLYDRQRETLAFMHDFSIPFTNNLGERDIRMNRLKQKISGCFRSFHGAEMFCRIRGYISTARKQGWNILQSLELAVIGTPLIPNLT